jgi:hypothetical protein
MSLFVPGPFKSAAGLTLPFKIECDRLNLVDWHVIATQCRAAFPHLFPHNKSWAPVLGVPTGGRPLQDALINMLIDNGKGTNYEYSVVIVDDVWTTGKSMLEYASKNTPIKENKTNWNPGWYGYVAFARGPLPLNVRAFMKLGDI